MHEGGRGVSHPREVVVAVLVARSQRGPRIIGRAFLLGGCEEAADAEEQRREASVAARRVLRVSAGVGTDRYRQIW